MRDNLLQIVLGEVERLNLSDIEFAAACGFSVPTASAVRNGHRPKQKRCIDGLRAFAQRARLARGRADLGLRS